MRTIRTLNHVHGSLLAAGFIARRHDVTVMNDEGLMTNGELNSDDEIKTGSARFQRAAIGIFADCTKPQTGAATAGKVSVLPMLRTLSFELCHSFDIRRSSFVISFVRHSSLCRP